jgi:hypothetical protein
MISRTQIRPILVMVVAAAMSVMSARQLMSPDLFLTLRSIQTNEKVDFAVYNETRYKGLRQFLPASGVVGHLSGLDQKSLLGRAALAVTRYSLAPVQVAQGTDQDLVVGDFYDLEEARLLIASHHLKVERDLGLGVMLLRHTDR